MLEKNSMLLEGNKIVQFNAYKPWFLPSEMKFYGKIALEHLNMNVFDYLHLNTMIPKITLEAKIHKDEQKFFHYLLTTIETPMKLHVFFPYLFQNILSMTQEHIEISHEHVVLGNKQVITTLCNLTTKKIITKVIILSFKCNRFNFLFFIKFILLFFILLLIFKSRKLIILFILLFFIFFLKSG